MQVISYHSRISTTQEQKLSTVVRELCAITFALSQYEFLIICSTLPITAFTDHNPSLKQTHHLVKHEDLLPTQRKKMIHIHF